VCVCVCGCVYTLYQKPYGGKLLVTQSNLPNAGMGALKNRDDIKLYYTDNEKMLFVPQDSFYEKYVGPYVRDQLLNSGAYW